MIFFCQFLDLGKHIYKGVKSILVSCCSGLKHSHQLMPFGYNQVRLNTLHRYLDLTTGHHLKQEAYPLPYLSSLIFGPFFFIARLAVKQKNFIRLYNEADF